jgi:uncharacterized alpha/beta hydrolase family protein
MKKSFFTCLMSLLIILILSYPVSGTETTTYRDRSGKYQGKSVQQGNTTTYRDRTGKYQGKSVNRGNKIEYRDRSGKKVGSATINK